jgi:acetyl esterase/lipase
MNDSSQLLDKLATIPKQTLDRLDPEYRDFILSQPAASLTPPHKIGWSPELRRAINSSTAGKGDAVPVGSTESFDLDNCTVLVFIPSGQTPKEGWPVYIYAHGGGFLFGTSRSEESFTTRVCAGKAPYINLYH